MSDQNATALVAAAFGEISNLVQKVTVDVKALPGTPKVTLQHGTCANVALLLMRIPANRVDGATVQPNDEQALIPAGMLTEGYQLKPNDEITGAADGIPRRVITAHLDAAGVLWTCAVRRLYE